MKSRKSSLVLLLAALGLAATTAMAGTPGITGTYSGYYDLTVRHASGAPGGTAMGIGTQSEIWEFDFDQKCAWFSGGTVQAQPPMSGNYDYTVGNFVRGAGETFPIDDHGDGTYTVYYRFQALNPNFNYPVANVSSTLEITQSGTSLVISTIDMEVDNNFNGVVGTVIPTGYGFPFTAERDWSGDAWHDTGVSLNCP